MASKLWLLVAQSLLVLQLILIGVCYFQFAIRSPGQFFGRTPKGEVIKLVALDRPNVSVKALLNWATLAATATFAFDFVNYQKQLNALKEYFTNDGYTNFIASLESMQTLTTIRDKKLIVSSVAIGPAIVLLEEELGKQHTWRIQVPILVRYQSANVNETREQLIEMLVAQVSTRDAPKGIGIAQYIARDTGAEL
jgi:intracellular multiplication protein IcmL